MISVYYFINIVNILEIFIHELKNICKIQYYFRIYQPGIWITLFHF